MRARKIQEFPHGLQKAWPQLLPKDAKLRQHGRHIYMFRNVMTNQILYSFVPQLHQRSLNQLPFIAKHSVPQEIRPDLWTPYCRVGPFPSPEQGLHAFRKLREFRKMHELCWDKTNGEWHSQPKKKLAKLIMDQRANATVDLARVLEIQKEQSGLMEKSHSQREREREEFLERKWTQLETMARLVEEGEIEKLEKKIRDCKAQVGMHRAKQNEPEDVKERATNRLNTAMRLHRRRIQTLSWGKRMVDMRNEADAADDAIKSDRIRVSLLPQSLKAKPEPFSLEGVEVHWADLYDAEHTDSWPEATVHDTFEYITRRRSALFESEYQGQLIDEASSSRQSVGMGGSGGLEPEEKKGIMKYIPDVMSRNPFKRASTQ